MNRLRTGNLAPAGEAQGVPLAAVTGPITVAPMNVALKKSMGQQKAFEIFPKRVIVAGYNVGGFRTAKTTGRASGGLFNNNMGAASTVELVAWGIDMPLLLQGEGSKNDLLQRFRHLGNAILVGSQSFWEGVDVRGEALSLVVIDKIPFAPPDDPVLAARIEQMRLQGRNPFIEYQLPRAVINVKQGAGRLIRDETDRGVLMICDPRLLSKPYGRRVWQSLPAMKRTKELADVIDFFARR